MTEEDEAILVCALAEKIDRPLVPSTGQGFCSECEREVVVAPSGQKILIDGNVRIMCDECGEYAMALDPEPVMLPPTVEQLFEIALFHQTQPPVP